MVSKFHDDPTVNNFEIVVLLGEVWVCMGKRKGFGRGRKENEFKKKIRIQRVCVKREIVKQSHFVERKVSLCESVIISRNR